MNTHVISSIYQLLERLLCTGHKGLAINHREAGLHYTGKESKTNDPLLTQWRTEYEQLPDDPIRLDNSGHVVSLLEFFLFRWEKLECKR